MSETEQSRFLTSMEAALAAGVKEETIVKYRDLGLLRSFRVNGQDQYREDEIKLIFNSKKKKTEQTAPKKTPSEEPQDSSTNKETLKDTSQGDPQEHSKGHGITTKEEVDKDELRAQEDEDERPPTLKEILSEKRHEKPASKASKSESLNEPRSEAHERSSYSKSSDNRTLEYIKHFDGSNEPAHFDIPSIELLELTRALKDQLEIIKEERNWLRRRVEKLEASVEREQIIAISKTETIRNLIDTTKVQKRPWAFLLPWNK